MNFNTPSSEWRHISGDSVLQDEFDRGMELCYDRKYALRLCSEFGHKRECVHIYSQMRLYEEAVDLALTVRLPSSP